MKELGEYLRDTRIQNGVSIEEAAEDNELSASQLENIENGNMKAFKDVYKLKEYMKNYAKYLGLDPTKVSEEFNDFLFEHTSKISIEDILEAKKQIEEKETKKIQSPYTKEYKDKINYKPILYICQLWVSFSQLVMQRYVARNNIQRAIAQRHSFRTFLMPKSPKFKFSAHTPVVISFCKHKARL